MSNPELVLQYLNAFKGHRGIYVIRPKSIHILESICNKLGLPFRSDVAYVGKAEISKAHDLRNRAKQEMGWSNFEGATFVRKIGRYLDYDIKDKKNKQLQENTKEFICSNFIVECISINGHENLLDIEEKYIDDLRSCLNIKNVKR